MSAEALTGASGAPIPRVSGGGRITGHMMELRHQPLQLLERVVRECGELGEFRLFDRPVAFMSGARAQEFFFRAADEVLDPTPTSNQLMKPVFGEGVVYDVPPERRREMLRSPALRDKNLRRSAEVIAEETERMLARLGSEGEIDLLDFAAELTIYTSSSCLIGRPFREQLTPEFSRAYFDLEAGTDALGFIDSSLDIASFRLRDRARARLCALIGEIIEQRRAVSGEPPRDMLQVLLSLEDDGVPRFGPEQIAGILVSTMFAGHHTSAGTLAWTLVELLRVPGYLARVVEELDGLYAGDVEVSYQALREIPLLENAVKETLRLHPPLILLPRTAMQEFHYGDHVIAAGTLVAAAPAISHRDASCFPEPGRFEPERFGAGREEDLAHPWSYVPFGGGRHRCLGSAFALMQQKAIFSILLRRYTFELAAPSDSYRDDYSKMVVRPFQPFRVHYRARA